MSFPQTALVSLLLVAGATAQAQTSLFLPGFDAQPLSVDVAGVDAEGRTTYILQTGAMTDSEQEYGFVGTATLVEADNYASFTYDLSGVTMGYDCTISAGTAVCSADGETETIAVEEYEVLMQVGTTATGAAPVSSPTGDASSSGASSGTQTSSSSSPSPSDDTDFAMNNSPAWGLGALVSSVILFVACV